MNTLASWSSDRACAVPDFTDSAAVGRVEDCRAERTFVAMLRNPDRFLGASGEHALHQLWRTENLLDINGDPEVEPAVELAQYLFASTHGRFRKGLNLDPSTIIATDAWWLKVAHVLPNWGALGLADGSLELGWRPSIFVSRNLEITAPLGYYSIRPASAAVGSNRASRVQYGFAGMGVTWLRDGLFISSFQAAVERFAAWHDESAAEPRSPIAVEANAFLLAEKIRIGYRRTFWNDTPLLGAHRGAFTLGMSDLNGAVFWTLRQLGTCRRC